MDAFLYVFHRGEGEFLPFYNPNKIEHVLKLLPDKSSKFDDEDRVHLRRIETMIGFNLSVVNILYGKTFIANQFVNIKFFRKDGMSDWFLMYCKTI